VRWYRDVLGLPHLFTFGKLAFFDCHGVRLFLSAEEQRGSEPGESVLYFQTTDIEQSAAALQSRGVTFRGAPHMIHRHESGVEEWMAFFDDPDGNVLALMSQVKPES
jgi:predicted enzyme related to lactoylglutathione lyase